jgi:hypothetical protein
VLQTVLGHRRDEIGHHGRVGVGVEGSRDAGVGVRAALHAAMVKAPTP